MFQVSLWVFMYNFKLFTDCARNMHFIVGASTSAERVEYWEKWTGSVSQKLNTAMKHVMNRNDVLGGTIGKDLIKVN